jgi:transcriptional regulator with GAF, ATPase, and Fis domain
LHEAIVGVEGGTLATVATAVRFTHGPLDGTTRILNQSRTWLGGGDSDIVLEGLPRQAVALRVSRGRAMLQPTTGTVVLLAGAPVTTLVPILEHEEIRVGPHGFVIETEIRESVEERDSFGAMVGRTANMRALFGVLARIAVHDHPMLLTGESGTGKELAAKAVHDEGSRSGGPFVAVNCAAMPDTLVESELFGHEKGAFTGATDTKDGAFQRADGGTLFLDEIGELKLDAQAKLLRALESGEVRRVGAAAPTFPDVRIVAATNRDLDRMVSDGTFRGDLLFRLSVLTVHLPPLRERSLDVPVLARAIVERDLPGAVLTEAATLRLATHSWPGNVRELRNVLTRAFVLGGPVIEPENLTFAKAAFNRAEYLAAELPGSDREAIQTALQRANGNKSQAARILGIPRSSLLYRMKRLGIA